MALSRRKPHTGDMEHGLTAEHIQIMQCKRLYQAGWPVLSNAEDRLAADPNTINADDLYDRTVPAVACVCGKISHMSKN